MSVQDVIRDQVTNNDVVLYMKGSPQFPQCGFSSAAVQILKGCGVQEVLAVNVLSDDEIRQGIKAFSNWPTIPQLYVKGEFVGGCDIIREMFETGELEQVFKENQVLQVSHCCIPPFWLHVILFLSFPCRLLCYYFNSNIWCSSIAW